MKSGKHPEHLSDYINRHSSDMEVEEIRTHLEFCAECREELHDWESLKSLFRSPDLEIEVPLYQWQRIKARLQSSKVEKQWLRLIFGWRPTRLAYGIAFGLLLLFGASLLGWEYRRHLAQEDFLAIAAYSESQQVLLARAENPFATYASVPAGGNPFTKYQSPGESNPFTAR